MKTIAVSVLAAVLAFGSTVLFSQNSGAKPATSYDKSRPAVTQADYDRWKKELSNWGRWGKRDELGALNLITPAKRKQAAALVKEGFAVSLARDAETEKAVDNPQPFEHQMLSIGSDRISVAFHGQSHTHMDALGHTFEPTFDGKAYNGYAPTEAEVKQAGGHARNSIHNVKNGVVTRGVLIDIPRFKGVPYLEPGTPIYADDLEAWEKKTGVRVTAGDALFIRTGRWVRRASAGPWDVSATETGRRAGLDASVLPWLRLRDIAVLGSDIPQSVNPGIHRAAHDFPLVVLGVHLLDNCDLEALADAAAARQRWEFMLTVAPLAIRGATGSPVNPLAIF